MLGVMFPKVPVRVHGKAKAKIELRATGKETKARVRAKGSKANVTTAVSGDIQPDIVLTKAAAKA